MHEHSRGGCDTTWQEFLCGMAILTKGTPEERVKCVSTKCYMTSIAHLLAMSGSPVQSLRYRRRWLHHPLRRVSLPQGATAGHAWSGGQCSAQLTAPERDWHISQGMARDALLDLCFDDVAKSRRSRMSEAEFTAWALEVRVC